MLTQKIEIGGKIGGRRCQERHAPLDPPPDGAGLVVAEIMRGMRLQKANDFAKARIRSGGGGLAGHNPQLICQRAGNVGQGQGAIDQPGCHRSPRRQPARTPESAAPEAPSCARASAAKRLRQEKNI